MTPLPLKQIGLRWRDHRSALWWLGILYRRPQYLRQVLEALPNLRILLAISVLYLHILPYIVVLGIIGRFTFFYIFELELKEPIPTKLSEIIFTQAGFLVSGILDGIIIAIIIEAYIWFIYSMIALKKAGTIGRSIRLVFLGSALTIIVSKFALEFNFGVPFWVIFFVFFGIISHKKTNTKPVIDSFWIVSGLAFAIIIGLTFGIIDGLKSNIISVLGYFLAFGIDFGITRKLDTGRLPDLGDWVFFGVFPSIIGGISAGISYGSANGIVVGVFYGIAIGIILGISVGFTLFRIYYYPVHLLFIWPISNGQRYPLHPVAWDDLCSLPFPRFDHLLVAYADHDPNAARTEIERLIDHYPSQRLAALRAKARMIARASAQEVNLSRLDAHVARLPAGDRGFLTQTPKIRTMVGDIGQLQMRLDTLDRPFLREPTAALLVEKIKNFQSQVAGFPEPLASEFRQAAGQWLAIAECQHQQIRSVLNKEPTPQVFRAGDPVDRNQEAFIPRESVLGDLDRQLTLSTGCPGLILYGRRRMGKSTLLRNLEGFLPTSVRSAVVSMQNPDAFSSQADLLNAIAQRTSETIQTAQKATAPALATLKEFFQWLADCNARLAEMDRRLLLAIDEYENLDRKLGEGVFSEDLLATMRESIQMHRQVTWVFAGSHAITELTHAPWSSYLVSARTLEVPPFTEAETRRLLTEPLRYSSLWRDDDSKRPRFNPDFWGDDGIERIHVEAGGWPHLVQLLAETVVDMCNDRGQPHANQVLLEQAIAKAIVAGDAVLRQLMQPEEAVPGEWAYLRSFRTCDAQPPPDDEVIYQALRRRLLVAVEGGQWRLRVPLMQRWLRERG